MSPAANSARTITIDATLTKPQYRVFASSGRFVWMSGGYGSGKSYAAAMMAIRCAAQNSGMTGGLISASFPALTRDVLPILFERLDHYGIAYDYSVGDRRIDIESGTINSSIQLGSADNAAHLKGPTWAWIVCDEPGRYRRTLPGLPGTIWEVLVSRVRHPAGENRIFLFGTPEGAEGWLPEQFLYGPVDAERHAEWSREYEVVYADTRSNPYLPRRYVEQLMVAFDANQQREKIEGRPAMRLGSAAYYAYDRMRHVKPCEYDVRRGAVAVGMDFNVDPMSAAMMQDDGRTLYVLDELSLMGSSTWEMGKALVLWARRHRIEPSEMVLYPDPAARARSTKGRSDLDILRECGFTTIRVFRAAPSQRDRLNAVNAMFYKDRVQIDLRCGTLARDLAMVRTRAGTGELDKSDRTLTHMSDALGYYIAYEHPIKRPVLHAL